MKKYLYFLVFLFITLNLVSQSIRLDSLIDKNDGYYLIVLKSNNKTIDTFSRSPFYIKLIDTYFCDSIISYIYEAPSLIGYDKYIKTDTGWVWSKTSGVLSGRPDRIASMPTPELLERRKKKREFKIIGDDKVYMKIGDRETIIDCNDFKVKREAREREYQEWLIKEEAKKQEEKKKKDRKIDKK